MASSGIPHVFRWFPHCLITMDVRIVFSWFSHGFPIYFPWISWVFLGFSYVLAMFFPQIFLGPAVLRRQRGQALHFLGQVLQLLRVARRLPGGGAWGYPQLAGRFLLGKISLKWMMSRGIGLILGNHPQIESNRWFQVENHHWMSRGVALILGKPPYLYNLCL